MFMMISFRGLLLLLSREFFIFQIGECIYFTVRRGEDFWAKNLSEGKAPVGGWPGGGERIALWF